MSVNTENQFTSALNRAKQIAAKLKNTKDLNGSQDFERKRSFDGEEPASKRPMTMDGGFMGQGGSQGTLKDEIRVQGSVIQFLSGEALGQLQSQTGCHIQIPPPGPDPNAERSITLSGNMQCIEQCKAQIKEIIHSHAPHATIGGLTGGMPHEMGKTETVDMLIPANKVGLVIGKGGDTIKDLAVQTGCNMKMVQDGMYEKAPEKPLRLHGTPFEIQKARKMVSELIQNQEHQNRNNYGQQGGGFSGGNQGPFEHTINISVEKQYVGFVIGKGGETIKRLQGETGASVQFNTIDQNAPGERYLIVGGTKAQCDDVDLRVKDILSKAASREQFPNSRFQPGSITEQYPVPANKCGLVIGKQGVTIKKIIADTGAHVEMNKNSPHDAPMKEFNIRGNPEQIQRAKQELEKIVGGGDSYGYGGGYQQQHQQSYQAPHHVGYPPQPAAYNPMMAAPAQDPAAMYAQYYGAAGGYPQQYYQPQQAAAPQAAAAPAASAAPAAAATTTATSSANQQWAEYYQKLVAQYGEAQAQVFWTQLSQQPQMQGGATQ